MNRILFFFELSIFELKKSIKINVLVFCSLAVGLLLPLMALANINVFYLNIKNLYPNINKNTYFCNVKTEHLTEDAYLDIGKSLELVKIGGCENTSDKIAIDDRVMQDALCVVSEEFLDFVTYDVLEGESIVLGGNGYEKVCMVEESFFSTYKVSAKLGDSVEVEGVNYVIVGIFRSMDFVNKVLVPLEDFENKGISEKSNYTMFVQCREQEGEGVLQEMLREKLGQVQNVESIEHYYEKKRARCIVNALSIFGATIPVTLFSLVNCILVLYGKVIKMKYETGIKIAFGAKQGDLLLSYFFETSILALGAYLLDIMLMPLIARTTPTGFILKFDGTVYVCGLFLVELLCFVISKSLVWKVTRLDIASVLKGE